MRMIAVAAALIFASAAPGLAANVDQPYQNVDKRNDAGNSTGDSRVDTLNRGQLDENQRGSGQNLGGQQAPAASAPSR